MCQGISPACFPPCKQSTSSLFTVSSLHVIIKQSEVVLILHPGFRHQSLFFVKHLIESIQHEGAILQCKEMSCWLAQKPPLTVNLCFLTCADKNFIFGSLYQPDCVYWVCLHCFLLWHQAVLKNSLNWLHHSTTCFQSCPILFVIVLQRIWLTSWLSSYTLWRFLINNSWKDKCFLYSLRRGRQVVYRKLEHTSYIFIQVKCLQIVCSSDFP